MTNDKEDQYFENNKLDNQVEVTFQTIEENDLNDFELKKAVLKKILKTRKSKSSVAIDTKLKEDLNLNNENFQQQNELKDIEVEFVNNQNSIVALNSNSPSSESKNSKNFF